MAIQPSSAYPGQINTPGPIYPYGQAQNETTPNDGTGTPLEKAWVNDWFGFTQAALVEANIVPSGSPDTATTSQILTALKKLRSFESVTQMTTAGSAGSSDNELRTLLGYYEPGGGGAGLFYWDAASTATADGVITLAVSGTATGRWVRIAGGVLTPEMAGCFGDGVSDDTFFLAAAVAAAVNNNLQLVLPAGKIYLVPDGADIAGDANYRNANIRADGGVIKWTSNNARFDKAITAGRYKVFDYPAPANAPLLYDADYYPEWLNGASVSNEVSKEFYPNSQRMRHVFRSGGVSGPDTFELGIFDGSSFVDKFKTRLDTSDENNTYTPWAEMISFAATYNYGGGSDPVTVRACKTVYRSTTGIAFKRVDFIVPEIFPSAQHAGPAEVYLTSDAAIDTDFLPTRFSTAKGTMLISSNPGDYFENRARGADVLIKRNAGNILKIGYRALEGATPTAEDFPVVVEELWKTTEYLVQMPAIYSFAEAIV